MRSIKRQHLRLHLIDFALSEPACGLTFNEHLRAGPVTLTHCTSRPMEGRYLAASQLVVAIHEGKAFEMNWRGVESDRIQSITVSHGQTHVGDARLPVWVRYSASPSFFVLAHCPVEDISLVYCRRSPVQRSRPPSRPGEMHPEPLTDPDLILSHHPARATVRRLPPSVACQVPPVAG